MTRQFELVENVKAYDLSADEDAENSDAQENKVFDISVEDLK